MFLYNPGLSRSTFMKTIGDTDMILAVSKSGETKNLLYGYVRHPRYQYPAHPLLGMRDSMERDQQ